MTALEYAFIVFLKKKSPFFSDIDKWLNSRYSFNNYIIIFHYFLHLDEDEKKPLGSKSSPTHNEGKAVYISESGLTLRKISVIKKKNID